MFIHRLVMMGAWSLEQGAAQVVVSNIYVGHVDGRGHVTSCIHHEISNLPQREPGFLVANSIIPLSAGNLRIGIRLPCIIYTSTSLPRHVTLHSRRIRSSEETRPGRGKGHEVCQ